MRDKRWRFVVLLITTITMMLGASCAVRRGRCDAKEIYQCYPAGDSSCAWQKYLACAEACVEAADDAFCALSATRTASCPMEPTDPAGAVRSYCDGDVLVHCRDGYAIERVACDSFCVAIDDGDTDALCSLSPEPSSACADRISTCIDGAIVACESGYPTRRAACPEKTACHLFDPSNARGSVTQASEAACLDADAPGSAP